MAIDPESAAGFEEDVLPGLAGLFDGGDDPAPGYEDINGVTVAHFGPNSIGNGAYAWVKGSIATVLHFSAGNAAEAEAFVQGALG